MSYYRDQLEAWLQTIEVNTKSVLDVGGAAKPVKDRVKVWNVNEYEILDNGSEEKKVSIDYFKDLNTIVDLPRQFQVVFCLEVFEYIWNPVQALENLNSFLHDIGTAYISFPAIYPVHNPKPIDYLRYTKAGVEKLLAETGFTSWEITPRVATMGRDHLYQFYISEAMKPVKGDPVIFDIGYCVKVIKE